MKPASEATIRDDVRDMAGDSVTFIGYVRGLLGSGNNPYATRLAVVALDEQKIMRAEGAWNERTMA